MPPRTPSDDPLTQELDRLAAKRATEIELERCSTLLGLLPATLVSACGTTREKARAMRKVFATVVARAFESIQCNREDDIASRVLAFAAVMGLIVDAPDENYSKSPLDSEHKVSSGRMEVRQLVAASWLIPPTTTDKTVRNNWNDIRGAFQHALLDVLDEYSGITRGPEIPTPTQSDAVVALTPRQLPRDIPDFTGRSSDLHSLALLRDTSSENVPVLISTITGIPGVGKTALAIHWAHRIAPEFTDGQIYIDLQGFGGLAPIVPTEAVSGILRTLGIGGDQLPRSQAELVSLYRTTLADKHMLILLDNAESSEQVRPLLPGGTGCLVIVTSRNILEGLIARDSARLIALDLMSPDESVTLLNSIVSSNRSLEPNHALRLAMLCGYLPMAVRIAGSRLATRPTLHVADMIAELEDEQNRLDALSVEGSSVAIRSVFESSYMHLSSDRKLTFRRLSLLPGVDFGTEVVINSVGLSKEASRESIGVLLSAHLLEERIKGRLRFHDLLRLYARDRAAFEDSEEDRLSVIARALTWYLVQADAADKLLTPSRRHIRVQADTAEMSVITPSDRNTAFSWFEIERGNLIASIRLATESGLDDLAWQLADSMWSFFYQGKYWDDWLETHELGLVSAHRVNRFEAQALMHNSMGIAYDDLGEFNQAISHFEQSLTIRRRISDRTGEGITLGNLAMVYNGLGDQDRAASLYEESLVIRREVGDKHGEGAALNNLGEVRRRQGRYSDAIRHYEESLFLRRQVGDRLGEGVTLSNLGETYLEKGDLRASYRYLDEALTVRREIKDEWGQGRTLTAMGKLYIVEGDRAKATACWQQALELFRRTNAPQIAQVIALINEAEE